MIRHLFFRYLPFMALFWPWVALRSESVGRDTWMYLDIFDDVMLSSVEDVAETMHIEMGYLYFNRVVSLVHEQGQLLLAVAAFLTLLAICRFLVKHADWFWLGCLFFVLLRFYDFSFSLERQYLAIALVLCSVGPLLRKNFVRFAVLVALASLFHRTAIVFFVAYFVKDLPINRKTAILYLLALVLLVASAETFGEKVFGAIAANDARLKTYAEGDEFIAHDGALAPLCDLVIGLGSLVMSYLPFKNCAKVDDESGTACVKQLVFVRIMAVGVLWNAAALWFTQFGRIAMYFNFVSIAALPAGILKCRHGGMLMMTVVVFLAAYYAVVHLLRDGWVNLYPYSFFWEA